MADVLNFKDAFIDGLRDTYDAERQVARALPVLAESATSPELRSVFESHLRETRDHLDRLDQVFWLLDRPADGKHCEGVAAIIEACMSILADEPDGDAKDAQMIASVLRIQQYEKAAYATLVAWADRMRRAEVADLLRLTLEEGTHAGHVLSTLADARYMTVAATSRSRA